MLEKAVLFYLPNAYLYQEEEMLLSLLATNIYIKICHMSRVKRSALECCA